MMNRLKSLIAEARSLEVYEVETQLQNFLKEKHGITASVNKFDNKFKVYISNYSIPEEKPESLDKELVSKMKTFDFCKDTEINVRKTKYGYEIVMSPESKKLMEKKENTFKCALCESEHKGKGHNMWPIDKEINNRCCDVCNEEFIAPARSEHIKMINESTEEEVEKRASNLVLDGKFIWLFSVLDAEGEDIADRIEVLQDAIEVLIENDAAFLVAFPYVDPSPGDDNVDLVFADNPGPVVVYDREEATAPKPTKPTKEEQPKQGLEDLEIDEDQEDYDLTDEIAKLEKELDN